MKTKKNKNIDSLKKNGWNEKKKFTLEQMELKSMSLNKERIKARYVQNFQKINCKDAYEIC